MRRVLPPWAIGLAMAPLGCYFGFISTAMPLLLATSGIPVDRIAIISTISFSPTFWGFLLSPILDVRFHKRFYSVLMTLISAGCLAGAVLSLHHLVVFTVMLTAGCTSTTLFQGALTGWMPDIVGEENHSWLGAVMMIANIGTAGVFGTVAIVTMRLLAPGLAAVLLGCMVAAPLVLLIYFPEPVPPKRSVGGTFRNLFRDLYTLCRRRTCLLGMIALLSPCSCFALTNLYSGLGADFHAPEHWVTMIGGVGVAIACTLGCLAGAPICQRYPRRTVYIATGLFGAVVSMGAVFAPKTEMYFTIAILAYNFFQGINYTAFMALCLQIVGAENHLAATQMSLLLASANFSISYMTWVDGRGYAMGGIRGLFAVDAMAAGIFCVALLWFLHWLEKRRPVDGQLRDAVA